MSVENKVNKESDNKSMTDLMNRSENWMLETGDYLVHLLRCALREKKPQSKPDSFTYEALYYMAKKHNIESMVFAAIEPQLETESKLYKEWQEAADRNILKSILQDQAEKELVGTLSKAGIKIVTLKGAIMKYLYPQEDYRQMSDVDILFEQGKDVQVREVAEACGYTTDLFHKGYVGVYQKMPYVSVELHACLESNCKEQKTYFEGIWDRLLEDAGMKNCFHMTKEDFWIYLLVHHAKHYFGDGFGIRPMLDLYLYNQKYGSSMDWENINKVLKEFKLYEFAQKMMALAEVWFGDGTGGACESQRETEAYIYSSGSYGTIENGVRNGLGFGSADKKQSRLQYCISRLYKPFDTMCGRYPCLERCPVLYVGRGGELIETYNMILNTRETSQAICDALDGGAGTGQLGGTISCSVVEGTDAISVNVVGADPIAVKETADAAKEVLPGQIEKFIEGTSVIVLENAIVPTAPFTPNYARNMMIGAIVGLFISTALLILKVLLEKKITSVDYLKENYEDIPLLAIIPVIKIKI